MIHLPRVFLNSLLAVLFLLLYGCLQVPAPAAMDTPAPTATATIPPLTLSGPETRPNSPRPYPSTLTVEMAQQGISAVVDAPPSITGLPDVQAIITKHTQLARDVGLSFDHMAVKYVAAEQRWFLVPVESGGTIAGWLEIADPLFQSGWRYGEQPTWDSQYHPSTDTYQYGLPALHDPANHFEIGFANGFPILIEVTPSSTPQYWNNIVEKSMMLVERAVIPTETPIPTEVYQPRQVELVFAPEGVTVPDSCKVVPEATADNSLTLNGQPLPDGTVIDSYRVYTGSTGTYKQPVLLIAARAVAIETLDPVQHAGKTLERYLLCFNVTLPSGDNAVIASHFYNTTTSGFSNTFVYTPVNSEVSGLMLDQTDPNRVPIAVMSNAEFVALFTSGRIIGQQVLLPFEYNYPSDGWAAGENPIRLAIVTALKAGKLPLPVHFMPLNNNSIGTFLVVPADLVP